MKEAFRCLLKQIVKGKCLFRESSHTPKNVKIGPFFHSMDDSFCKQNRIFKICLRAKDHKSASMIPEHQIGLTYTIVYDLANTGRCKAVKQVLLNTFQHFSCCLLILGL